MVMSEQQVNPEEPLDNSPAEPVDHRQEADPASQESPREDQFREQEMTVRSAPKMWPFLILGAVAGVLVALIVALTGTPSSDYTLGGTFGYFAIIFGVIGVGIAGVIFLILDRRSLKKSRSVSAKPLTGHNQDVKES